MSEQIIQALSAPGAPFEFNEIEMRGHTCRVFKHAANSLNELYDGLKQYSDSTFAVYDDRRLSYADAILQAASLAEVMQAEFNIGKGSRVAIVMRNSPEWLVSFIAITSLGAIAALVNSRGSVDEIYYSTDTSNCDLLIADEKTQSTLSNSDKPEQQKLSAQASVIFDLSGPYQGRTSTGKK